MANSALKCPIIILITARSFWSYNNILINFGQLYSNSCYTTFSIATLGMCIACGFHQLWTVKPCIYHIFWHLTEWLIFCLNWPCRYSNIFYQNKMWMLCVEVTFVSIWHAMCVWHQLTWVVHHVGLPKGSSQLEEHTVGAAEHETAGEKGLWAHVSRQPRANEKNQLLYKHQEVQGNIILTSIISLISLSDLPKPWGTTDVYGSNLTPYCHISFPCITNIVINVDHQRIQLTPSHSAMC